MRNDDIDDLTEQLRRVRINRDQTVRRIARAIEETRVEENTILLQIREARAATAAAAKAVANNNNNSLQHDRGNIFTIGDTVEITNHLRDEFGTVGTVTAPGRKFVEIRTSTGRYYTKAFWNIDRHPRTQDNDDTAQ